MAKEKIEDKSISDALKEINKKFGEGAAITASEKPKISSVISTGSLAVDIASGNLGLPMDRGWLFEIFGPESAGKSTVVQTIIGNFQNSGETCVLADSEGSLDPTYATALGVDLDKLILIQLDEGAGEAAYDKIETLVETGKVGLVVIDSYNGFQPKKVVDGDMEEQTIGLHARMLGKFVMKANSLAIKYKTKFIFCGQLREKIGVMFGSPNTTQGGNALKFYAHIRGEISRSITTDNSVWDGEQKIGNKTTIKFIKNKFAPPFTQATFNIIYGKGIDKISEIIDIAKELDVINKRGDTIKKGEDKYTVEEFSTLLKDNLEFYQSLREEIITKYNSI